MVKNLRRGRGYPQDQTAMNLSDDWLVGFIDGEGCLNLDSHGHATMKYRVQMQPEITVVQDEIDKPLLEEIQNRMDCGNVTVNRRDATGVRWHWRCKNHQDILAKVIPFFNKHPFRTIKKQAEFRIFKQICLELDKGTHRQSLAGFLKIYDLGVELGQRSRLTPPYFDRPKGLELRQHIEYLRKLQAKWRAISPDVLLVSLPKDSIFPKPKNKRKS